MIDAADSARVCTVSRRATSVRSTSSPAGRFPSPLLLMTLPSSFSFLGSNMINSFRQPFSSDKSYAGSKQ